MPDLPRTVPRRNRALSPPPSRQVPRKTPLLGKLIPPGRPREPSLRAPRAVDNSWATLPPRAPAWASRRASPPSTAATYSAAREAQTHCCLQQCPNGLSLDHACCDQQGHRYPDLSRWHAYAATDTLDMWRIRSRWRSERSSNNYDGKQCTLLKLCVPSLRKAHGHAATLRRSSEQME